MFNVPPPTPPPTRTHWVYDDPSGVAEPTPYFRPWRRRSRRRPVDTTAVRTTPLRRIAHREN